MRTTHYPQTSRRGGMHRLAPGFYVSREPGGTFLHVFRFNKRWYWLRQPKEWTPEKVGTLFLNIPFHRTPMPTYAMAVSAAKGNRAS